MSSCAMFYAGVRLFTLRFAWWIPLPKGQGQENGEAIFFCSLLFCSLPIEEGANQSAFRSFIRSCGQEKNFLRHEPSDVWSHAIALPARIMLRKQVYFSTYTPHRINEEDAAQSVFLVLLKDLASIRCFGTDQRELMCWKNKSILAVS